MRFEPVGVDWPTVLADLSSRGWSRLAGAVPPTVCEQLADAAPPTWSRLAELEASVRQGGLSCGTFVNHADQVIRDLADTVAEALTSAAPDHAPLPPFNEAQWGRDDGGVMFITAHRDPPTAGGVIAIVTLSGTARFRVRDDDGDHVWDTGDGDIVLLCGSGWPTPESRCPWHEAESPTSGGRMTLTLRHNTGGPGADYFQTAETG